MILEFKANAAAVEALRGGYEDPYRAPGLPVPAFGLRFDEVAAIGGHPRGDRSGSTPWGITAGLQDVQPSQRCLANLRVDAPT